MMIRARATEAVAPTFYLRNGIDYAIILCKLAMKTVVPDGKFLLGVIVITMKMCYYEGQMTA